MTRTERAAALMGTGLAVLALALWRRDIPLARLTRRYGDVSSRVLLLPNGTRLHYRDLGPPDAPVLMCLHGYSASSLDWSAWAERLAGRFRLLLVDLPGHGLTAGPAVADATLATMAACVAMLADALALPPFVLVGNSMGGQVAMTYAVAHPDRMAGLVLIASIGAAEPKAAPASRPPLALRLLASGIGRFALRHLDLTPLVRMGLRNTTGDRRAASPALVRQYTDLARAPGHRAILTSLQLGDRDVNLMACLPAFDRPTLVMAGDADRLVPVEQARALAAALPRSRLIVYRGIGHVPMQEIPDRSADDLIAWLDDVAGADPRPPL